jgi:hypothetical protein
VGAGAAAAARLLRHAPRPRRVPASKGHSLTVQATVAPELVADLADLLGRVTGRAASDQAGAIKVKLAPGIDWSKAEQDLRAVLHRWSEMHPGVRVRISAEEERRRRSPRRLASRPGSNRPDREKGNLNPIEKE